MRFTDSPPPGRNRLTSSLSRRSTLGVLLTMVVVLCALTRPLAAQQPAPMEVVLTVGLSPDTASTGRRDPLIRTQHLLDDARLLSMLRSGFPLRMHYRVELWRSRSGWFDAFSRAVEWDVVVRHEPLLDQYAVNTIIPGRTRENRYTGLETLSRALNNVVYQIAFRIIEPGDYYYATALQVNTLSDSDLDELERFLRGEPGTDAGEERDFGEAVGRGATRLLLKLAGLPSLRVEGRSGKFRVQ
jgi:hypothetical protein